MRRLLALLLLGLGSLIAAGTATAARYVAPAGSGALFLFNGHGWGHGVGMSQYGAYGLAQHGWTYDQILAHYYPGTTLGPAPQTTIRVLLADRVKTLAVSSDQPVQLTDGSGGVHTLAPGKARFGPGLTLAVDGAAAAPLEPPLTFAPADGSTLTLGGRSYRGQIVVDLVDGKLRAVDVVGLEDYLDGVVPAEMPSGWSAEALKAQAVAARSYALATRAVAAPFDVYADSRSQVYRGVAAEKPATTAAVAATAGQVLLYGGKVATTYFSSTSGGRTESAVDVWGGRSLPYLVSVDDPYDTISPYHDWGPVPVTARTVAQKLRVPGRVVDATTTANAAGRAATLDLSSLQPAGAAPLVTTVTGAAARAELGLRSTWFDVGVLALLPPASTSPVPFGTTVRLSGLVRGVPDAVVEERSSRFPWQELAPATPDAGGAVTVVVKPAITTDYRLATAAAAAAYVRVRVTPRVLLAAATRTEVSGTARPALPGADVRVQQQVSGSTTWTTVAHGTVGADGFFRVAAPLAPGTVRAAVLVAAAPAAAFTPADPYYAKQWYLAQDHAFDAWPDAPPTTLAPVKVAIVDSGADCALPDLAGRIVAKQSFVGGDPCTDTEGHGTVVAGEIAGSLDGNGIVGIAYSAQLLIAKVVRPDGNIPLQAEAAAIRWAADQGARVINLSLGGVRDPAHPSRDTFSSVEADAVAYAYAKGALLVAAVGNADEAYATPWPYASYPAALPHVLGVGALNRTGNVPDFSDHDPTFVDLVAPGVDVFSTFPLALTAGDVGCVPQGTTDCAVGEYRHPEGTSFAAPQVAGAAAVLFAVAPGLTNGQAETILERSASDVSAATGCRACPLGRDLYSGWGRLDVARAVQDVLAGGPLPARDRYETNDDAGTSAAVLWGKQRVIRATLDYYDDPVDVYRIALGRGEQLRARLRAGWNGANVALFVWRPGTAHVAAVKSKLRAAQSILPGAAQHLVFRAPVRGWYYVEAKATSPGAGAYSLSLTKTAPRPQHRTTTTA